MTLYYVFTCFFVYVFVCFSSPLQIFLDSMQVLLNGILHCLGLPRGHDSLLDAGMAQYILLQQWISNKESNGSIKKTSKESC